MGCEWGLSTRLVACSLRSNGRAGKPGCVAHPAHISLIFVEWDYLLRIADRYVVSSGLCAGPVGSQLVWSYFLDRAGPAPADVCCLLKGIR